MVLNLAEIDSVVIRVGNGLSFSSTSFVSTKLEAWGMLSVVG